MHIGHILHHCKPCIAVSAQLEGTGLIFSPEVIYERINNKVLKEVMENSRLIFMSPHHCVGGRRLWTFMPELQIRKGFFLPPGLPRAHYLYGGRKRKLETFPKNCPCTRELGFHECLVITFPISSLDYYEVFHHEKYRLKGDPSSFTSLHPRQKRLCLTKYYSLNYISLQNKSYRVPYCFEDHVRGVFPNPKNEFFRGRQCSDSKRQKTFI